MKKKKEFFRIRKDRKRKNGANARARMYVYIDRTARDRLPLFSQQGKSPTKAVDCFFIPTLVLFSKLISKGKAEPSRPVLFSKQTTSPCFVF